MDADSRARPLSAAQVQDAMHQAPVMLLCLAMRNRETEDRRCPPAPRRQPVNLRWHPCAKAGQLFVRKLFHDLTLVAFAICDQKLPNSQQNREEASLEPVSGCLRKEY
eukprot:2336923-Rhodomonas_salina.1